MSWNLCTPQQVPGGIVETTDGTVTRTFYWKPDDLELEVATYMQYRGADASLMEGKERLKHMSQLAPPGDDDCVAPEDSDEEYGISSEAAPGPTPGAAGFGGSGGRIFPETAAAQPALASVPPIAPSQIVTEPMRDPIKPGTAWDVGVRQDDATQTPTPAPVIRASSATKGRSAEPASSSTAPASPQRRLGQVRKVAEPRPAHAALIKLRTEKATATSMASPVVLSARATALGPALGTPSVVATEAKVPSADDSLAGPSREPQPFTEVAQPFVDLLSCNFTEPATPLVGILSFNPAKVPSADDPSVAQPVDLEQPRAEADLLAQPSLDLSSGDLPGLVAATAEVSSSMSGAEADVQVLTPVAAEIPEPPEKAIAVGPDFLSGNLEEPITASGETPSPADGCIMDLQACAPVVGVTDSWTADWSAMPAQPVRDMQPLTEPIMQMDV